MSERVSRTLFSTTSISNQTLGPCESTLGRDGRFDKTVVFPHGASRNLGTHAGIAAGIGARGAPPERYRKKSQDQPGKRQYFQGSALSTPNFSVRSGTYKGKGEHRWSSRR